MPYVQGGKRLVQNSPFIGAAQLCARYLSVLEHVLYTRVSKVCSSLHTALVNAAHLPVTPEVLHLLYCSWSAWPQHLQHDASMLWAASCNGFFGFFAGRGVHLPIPTCLHTLYA